MYNHVYYCYIFTRFRQVYIIIYLDDSTKSHTQLMSTQLITIIYLNGCAIKTSFGKQFEGTDNDKR